MNDKRRQEWDRLFKKDETAWRDRMVRAIDKNQLEDMDTCNLRVALIEMSASERAKVESMMRVLMVHLLKSMVQASKHTRSWNVSIIRSRNDLKGLFSQLRVLHNYGKSIMGQVYPKAMREAIAETGMTRAQFWDEVPFTFEQMMNDRFGVKEIERTRK